MKKPVFGVTIWRLPDLLVHAFTCTAWINDSWVPRRTIGLYSIPHRLKAAWLVFTGKADVVVWPADQ
jgi:hypothetical protein